MNVIVMPSTLPRRRTWVAPPLRHKLAGCSRLGAFASGDRGLRQRWRLCQRASRRPCWNQLLWMRSRTIASPWTHVSKRATCRIFVAAAVGPAVVASREVKAARECHGGVVHAHVGNSLGEVPQHVSSDGRLAALADTRHPFSIPVQPGLCQQMSAVLSILVCINTVGADHGLRTSRAMGCRLQSIGVSDLCIGRSRALALVMYS